MSFWAKLIGANVSQPIEAVGNVIDQLFTSDDERLSHAEVLRRLALQPQLAQIELNKVEAQHRSIFVAGARPFIMWVCGVALAFTFVANPVVMWATGQPGPEMQTEFLMELVIALLGLGAMRTFEKVKRVAK